MADNTDRRVNANQTLQWRFDIAASVDLFNAWFVEFAPQAYRETRQATADQVTEALHRTRDLAALTPEVLLERPEVLQTLRMATCPPIARDRLVGLSQVGKYLVKVMEAGRLPARMPVDSLRESIERMLEMIERMLDKDILPWLSSGREPTEQERFRASTIIADRLCGSVSDPIIRNAQEKRQLEAVGRYLDGKGYRFQCPEPGALLSDMEAGTYAFRVNVPTGTERRVTIPIDVVIQPAGLRPGRMPILIEAKSAGDFTNVNKRRKEEAMKIHQLRQTHGGETQLVLFLCGYFDSGYLGYEAAEGIDWIWEHRIEDMDLLGI